MTATSPSEKDRLIADLRHRLAEAEETLRAIRENEVDALVMRGPIADEVFTIGGDCESYRAFMETMEPGAVALDAAGRILYTNSAFEQLLGKDFAGLQGQFLLDVLPADTVREIKLLLADARATRKSCEVHFPRAGDGELDLYFVAAAIPLRLGTISGHAVTFADVTERVYREGLEQSELAARAVIDSANEAVLVCDRNGIITHANAASSIIYEGDRVGQAFADIIPLDFHGTSGVLHPDDMIAMVVAGTPLQGIEATAVNAPKVKDYLVSAAPLRVAGGWISGAVVTMVDLSHRKAAEERQQLLMRELAHRVKNSLAMVAAISARTASTVSTVKEFQAVFSGRIQALAATHNLLLGNAWSSLGLGEIVKSELTPYIDDAAGNVTIDGLNMAVAPRAAIAFGLIVHELTTNAVKYGSLSQKGGRITLREIGGNNGKSDPLVVEWRESGGPPVAPLERKGFGHTVITRSLQYGRGGGAELDFDPAGLVCRISIPPEELS
ncbi:MAG: PAS domain-containing protein [Beijerinckiaceae bacterium]|nr:MAG: PAS domain-containing protein [Beijerinckiaceae bacterium]